MKYDLEKMTARLRSLDARSRGYTGLILRWDMTCDPMKVSFRGSYLLGMCCLIRDCRDLIRNGAQPTGERPMMPLGLPA